MSKSTPTAEHIKKGSLLDVIFKVSGYKVVAIAWLITLQQTRSQLSRGSVCIYLATFLTMFTVAMSTQSIPMAIIPFRWCPPPGQSSPRTQ